MSTFNGTPREFIACVLRGSCPAASATVGATSTDFAPITASTPQLAVTVGVGNSLTLDYFDRMTGLLAGNQAQHPVAVWWGVNQAVGGIQTPALAAAFAAMHAQFYSPQRRCLLHFCELTNHIGAGASFTVARDAAIAYCNTARAAGWKLTFHIPTPRAQKSDKGYAGSFSAWAPGQKAIYEQARDYFRAHPEHYDSVIDLAAVPALASPFEPAFYLADGCHCTEAGIAAKAAAVAAATAALG